MAIPIGAAETFRGVIDLVAMKALIAQPDGGTKEEPIPATLRRRPRRRASG